MSSNLSFTRIIKDFNVLAKGAPKIFLPEGKQIEGAGAALQEQLEDVVLVLSDVPQNKLAEIEEALSEAAQGFIVASQSFRALKEHGKNLQESSSYELPKVGQAVERVGRSYEELGQVYKALLTAVREARTLNPST